MSPWVPTLTELFPKIQAHAGPWLGRKNVLYYCAHSVNSSSSQFIEHMKWISVNQQLLFLFWAMSFIFLLNCPAFILEWSHVRILKPSNQSELCHLEKCLLTRSLSLFSHEISNSGHFATKFSIPSLPPKSSCSLIHNNNSYSLPKGFSNHLEFSLKS